MAVDETRLGGGVTEELILEAIRQSGYPLQARAVEIASAALGDRYSQRTFEEWSFIDSDTGTVRQLDALIQRMLDDIPDDSIRGQHPPTDPRALLRYELDFLIECKQAELPFIFFTREDLHTRKMPTFLGLPNGGTLATGARGEEPTVDLYMPDFLPSFPAPPSAVSVSRCYRRKGGGLELSGDDVYRSLTAPIKKAFQHYETASQEGLDSTAYRDIRMVHTVVVIDAPMLACHADNGEIKVSEVEVVRLPLREPSTSPYELFMGGHGISLDFVHIDHLAKYSEQALTTAKQVAELLDSIALQVLTGWAVVDQAKIPRLAKDFLAATEPPIVGEAEVQRWMKELFDEANSRHAQADVGSTG